jgi:16S rRNA G966 N2-methylase RsmD
MIPESFTNEEKIVIANGIKNISINEVEREMDKLIEVGTNAHTIGPRSRLGNNVVDFFTFKQRLETKGKYDVSYFEFLANIEEFKKKKFIQTMLKYYKEVKNKNNTKNDYIVLKEVYNICISAINIMRPLNCMEIYTKYKAKRVLNFCAGWGGSTIAAAALNLDAFYGIEINSDLKIPYDNLITFLSGYSATYFDINICDAVDFDYSKIAYDTVFASPPYYFLEKYANNVKYNSKKEMEDKFYKPLFAKTYNGLQKGGHYIINVCKEVYDNVLREVLGEANEVFPLKKSKRQNEYTELVYVWVKL